MTDIFNWPEVKNGIAEIQFGSWSEFSSFIDLEMKEYENYVWRGQRNPNWKLETTIDRLRNKSTNQDWEFDDKHLEQFKYAVRGRRGKNPRNLESENDWWALGQHHGLATPLLDWTTSPFVAAYFAFISEAEEQENRAVYAMHKYSIEEKAKECKKQEEQKKKEQKEAMERGEQINNVLLSGWLDTPSSPPVEFIRPFSDENDRLVNQAGLFTRSPKNKPIDDWVEEKFEGENNYILFKLLIPNRERNNGLTMLNRMNINHLTLFPDLYGASNFTNIKSTIDYY